MFDGRGMAIGVAKSCVVLVFSVSLDIPSSKQQSPRPPPARRQVVLGPSLAPLPHPEPPVCLPITCTHTRVSAFSPLRACVLTYTRPENHIEDEEGEFPSRWERLEGRRAPVLVGEEAGGWLGRGCGGAAATERRSAVGTLDRMIRPSQRGIFRRPPYLARQSARLPHREEKEKGREKEKKRETYGEGTSRRAILIFEKEKEDRESAHRPGILSCHSSTPLKSYWCDGTLSSSW